MVVILNYIKYIEFKSNYHNHLLNLMILSRIEFETSRFKLSMEGRSLPAFGGASGDQGLRLGLKKYPKKENPFSIFPIKRFSSV
jgi:hypothetical protein